MKNYILPKGNKEREEVLLFLLNGLLSKRVGKDRLCINNSCKAPVDRFYELNIEKRVFICKCCESNFNFLNGTYQFEKYRVSMDDYYEIAFRQINRKKKGVPYLTAVEIHLEYGFPLNVIYHMLRTMERDVKLTQLSQA